MSLRTIIRIIPRTVSICSPRHGFQSRFLSHSRILFQEKGQKPPQIESKIEGWEEDLEPPADKKIKLLIRDYGSSVLVVHISLSLVSLGTCYSLVSAGVPVQEVLGNMEFLSEKTLEYASNGGTFAIAYVVHKCLMPIRIAATCFFTPILVNYLRGKGILKPHKVKTPQS